MVAGDGFTRVGRFIGLLETMIVHVFVRRLCRAWGCVQTSMYFIEKTLALNTHSVCVYVLKALGLTGKRIFSQVDTIRTRGKLHWGLYYVLY